MPRTARPAAERARLLATCPAEAPSWTDVDGPVSLDGLAERTAALDRAATVAEAYLGELPADMTGEVRLDHNHRAIVVQVTRDAERVRAELQRRFDDDDVTAAVETVRYSKAELAQAAATIRTLPGLESATVSTGGGDGRVEVAVRGDVGVARTAINRAVDPCMVKVRRGGHAVPLAPAAP
jgi:hypothetical protein